MFFRVTNFRSEVILSRMRNGAKSFHRRRAALRGDFCYQILGGGAYGSDSGLGKRGVDRDRGSGGGAVVEMAVVVESVSRASKKRERGIRRSVRLLVDAI